MQNVPKNTRFLYGQYISLCEQNFKKVFSKKNSYILQRCKSQDFEGVFFQSEIVSIYENVFGHMGWMSIRGTATKFVYSVNIPLRKKCPYSQLFWSAFSNIRTK